LPAIATVAFLFFNRLKPAKLSFVEKLLLGAGFIVLSAGAFIALKSYIVDPYKTAIVIFATSILASVFLQERIEVMITSFVIVYAASYVLYLISTIFSASITYLFGYASDSIYLYSATSAISIIAAILLTKIKVDFSPLYKKYASGIFLSISSLVIILYGLFKLDISDEATYLVIAGYVLLGYGIYSWLRRETTISKNENAKDVIYQKQRDILAQKERDTAELTSMREYLASVVHQHDYLASVVHKDDKRLDAMQRAVEKLAMRSEQPDILADVQIILHEIDMARDKDEKNYTKELLGETVLPQTGLQIVDAKFETVLERARLKSVAFSLEVNGDVTGLAKIIAQFDLANLIGDFTENAFTAIKYLAKDQPFHKIQFTVGTLDNGYELSCSDSGIPFNIDTLLKLGVARVTSHSDDGGSGYGYETIFGLLHECGASLVITEYEPAPFTYSKMISIRFDGKTDYIIRSFRADTIKKQNTNSGLTILNLAG